MKDKQQIAIFASGNGSNAQAIINHLEGHAQAEVVAIYSNNTSAYVLERAKNHNIPAFVFSKEEFRSEGFLGNLVDRKYGLIVLAGFMWLVPAKLVAAYPQRIINIHPALLPKFGGKGMYGQHVHEAVIAANEKKSGITIHYVNEKYDEGDIILQESCEVKPDDTAESLAARIHQLEHKFYPAVVEQLCLKNSQ
jgi:phosphoribosylglycinamide formyltransferase-1